MKQNPTIVSIDNTSIEGEGYDIILSNGKVISITIDNAQQCCENWGYIVSHDDDLKSYVGAEFLGLDLVDECFNKNKIIAIAKEENVDILNEAIFVNLETSRGLIQFTIYNEHNGYYGHLTRVIYGDDIIFKEYL